MKCLEIWQVLHAQEKIYFNVLRIRNCSNTLRSLEVHIRLIFSVARLYMIVIPDYISESIRSGDARVPLRLVSVCLSSVSPPHMYSCHEPTECYADDPVSSPFALCQAKARPHYPFALPAPLRAVSSSNLRHRTARRMTLPSGRAIALAP